MRSNDFQLQDFDSFGNFLPDEPIPGVLQPLILAYRLVWLGVQDGSYILAVEGYIDDEVSSELNFWSPLPVRFVERTADWMEKALQEQYARLEEDVSRMGLSYAGQFTEDFPLRRWLTALLKAAKDFGASDVHLELGEKKFQIRMRIRGSLEVMPSTPWLLGKYVLNSIKHLAGLNAGEKLLPQDGRFSYSLDGSFVEFRVSSLPTHAGESVVLRLLDRGPIFQSFEALGFPLEAAETLIKKVDAAQGLLIVTGSTGSGKTTTLYAILQILAKKSFKIISLEDPIEYPMPHVTQVSIQPREGKGFSEILKSALRHDPDVLFIGEIRDAKTAQLAVEAALTGHLVLTSLHGSTPWHGIIRLLEWGVDRYALASVLQGVWGQQLLRNRDEDQEVVYKLEVDSLLMSSELRAKILSPLRQTTM